MRSPWARHLVEGRKTWEIRSSKTTKLGDRICVGEIDTHTLVGEVTIVGCHLVAVRSETGYWQAPPGQLDMWIARPENLAKHGLATPLAFLPTSWKRAYAWVMAEARSYEVQNLYAPKLGCVVWMKPEKKPGSQATRCCRNKEPKRKAAGKGGVKVATKRPPAAIPLRRPSASRQQQPPSDRVAACINYKKLRHSQRICLDSERDG